MNRSGVFGGFIFIALVTSFAFIVFAAFPHFDFPTRAELRRDGGTIASIVQPSGGSARLHLQGSNELFLLDSKCGYTSTFIADLSKSSSPVLLSTSVGHIRTKIGAYRDIIAVERDGRILRTYEECESSWVWSNHISAMAFAPFVITFWFSVYRVWRYRKQLDKGLETGA